jgi:tetratricopeptide (TPR) repeat protein
LQYYRQFLDDPFPLEYSDEALYGVAWAQTNLGQIDDAIQSFQSLVQQYPQSELVPSSLYQLGTLLFQQNRLEDGIQVLEDYLTTQAGSEYTYDIMAQLGQAYYDQGQYDQAFDMFQQLAEMPENGRYLATALFMSGEAVYARKQYTEAIGYYQQLLEYIAGQQESQPGTILAEDLQLMQEAQFRIGMSFVNLEQYDQAIERLSAVLADTQAPVPYQDQVLYWLAESYFHQGNYQQAIEMYQQLLTQFPESSSTLSAQYGLAWSYYELKNWLRAIDAFELLYQRDPAGEFGQEALFQIANSYLNAGNIAQAEAASQRLQQQFPDSNMVRRTQFQLAYSYYQQGEAQKGIQVLTGVLASLPQENMSAEERTLREDAHNLLGWFYLQVQDFSSAQSQFEQVVNLSQDPKVQANALLKMGDALYNLGEYTLAQQAYLRIVNEFPESDSVPDARYNLLLSYLQQNDTARFVAESQTFLQAYPQHSHSAFVMYHLGDYAVTQQEYARAIELFQRLVATFPESELVDESAYGIGWCYFKLQQYPEAIEEFSRFLRTFPESELAPDSRYGIATAFFKQQNYVEAISEYTAIIENFPDFPLTDRVFLNLGDAYIGTDQFDEAVRVLEESKVRFPQQEYLMEVNVKFGYALARQGSCQEALPLFGQAVAGTNSAIAAEAQFRIGDCYADLDERDKAIVEYLKVVYLYPMHPEWGCRAQFRAAKMYEEVGKEEDAMNLYQKILGLCEDPVLLENAQKQVNDLTQELPKLSE